MSIAKFILITLCVIGLSAASISDVDKVDGGIGIHISNRLLNNLKEDLVQQIFDKLKSLEVPDQSVSTNLLGAIDINASLSAIDLKDIGCDIENSSLTFQSTYPHVLFKLTNFALNFDFGYSVLADPEIYKDVGNATINVAPFNMSFGMTTKVINGSLQTDLQVFSYGFDDYTVTFTGNGDLSFLLVTIADSFKEILKEDLSPNILAIMKGVVEPQLNTLLLSLGTSMDIYGMTVDYRFMNYQQYTDEDIALVLKGEVRPINEHSLPFENERRVPANFNKTGGDIQVFVSDYVIHSLLYSVYKTELLTMRITENPLSPGKNLKVGDITILFPSLADHYDKSTPVYLGIQSTRDYVPKFNVSNGETYLTLRLDFSIGVNPEVGKDVSLFKMLTQADMTLNYGLEDGSKIAASISSFKFKVVEVTEDEIGVDQDDINALLGIITGGARNYVNYALDAIDLPIPDDLPLITLDLNKTYIYEMNGYLTLDVTPKIGLKAKREKFVPMPFDRSKTLQSQLSTHNSKVEMFKRLIKATPLMGVINEAKRQKAVQEGIPQHVGVNMQKSPKTFTRESCEETSYQETVE